MTVTWVVLLYVADLIWLLPDLRLSNDVNIFNNKCISSLVNSNAFIYLKNMFCSIATIIMLQKTTVLFQWSILTADLTWKYFYTTCYIRHRILFALFYMCQCLGKMKTNQAQNEHGMHMTLLEHTTNNESFLWIYMYRKLK